MNTFNFLPLGFVLEIGIGPEKKFNRVLQTAMSANLPANPFARQTAFFDVSVSEKKIDRRESVNRSKML